MSAVTIAIANQKGGVGKTTTTVNLGDALARSGITTLIVDLDPQANATSSLGFEKKPGEGVYEPLLTGGDLSSRAIAARKNLWLVGKRTSIHEGRARLWGKVMLKKMTRSTLTISMH